MINGGPIDSGTNYILFCPRDKKASYLIADQSCLWKQLKEVPKCIPIQSGTSIGLARKEKYFQEPPRGGGGRGVSAGSGFHPLEKGALWRPTEKVNSWPKIASRMR